MFSIAHLNKQEAYLGILRLLLRQTEIEPQLSQYGGPKEGFLMLQQHTDSLYYERPLEERIEVATSLAEDSLMNPPEVFKIALARDGIFAPALFPKNKRGETLLHIVAGNIGRLVRYTSEKLHGILKHDYEVNLKGKMTQVSRHCIMQSLINLYRMAKISEGAYWQGAGTSRHLIR